MTQYLIILGGSIIDVVEAADDAAIQKVLANRCAMPEVFIALDASQVVTKEIIARSIELLKTLI